MTRSALRGLDKKSRGQRNVFIYGMGGGTFDVSLPTIEDGIQALQSEFCRRCCQPSLVNALQLQAEAAVSLANIAET